jgi:hypothetical protein
MLKKLGISVRNDSKPLELTCKEVFYSVSISCLIIINTNTLSSLAIKLVLII